MALVFVHKKVFLFQNMDQVKKDKGKDLQDISQWTFTKVNQCILPTITLYTTLTPMEPIALSVKMRLKLKTNSKLYQLPPSKLFILRVRLFKNMVEKEQHRILLLKLQDVKNSKLKESHLSLKEEQLMR